VRFLKMEHGPQIDRPATDQGMTAKTGDRTVRGTRLVLEPLRGRRALFSVTTFLIASNLLVAIAMLLVGAGLWHSSSAVQMAWGANFGPATKDGEWWRLGTAMFLHFGVVHLAMNMLALWDSGRLAERIFGPARFAAIYFGSGLAGNLLSLIVQGDRAVSGGASGAIFGIYGAFLVYLLHERRRLHPGDFRWMFWGAAAFSGITLTLGFLIPGIDNAAHVGGLVTGATAGFVLLKPVAGKDPSFPGKQRMVAAAFGLVVAALVASIPDPLYRWSEEQAARGEIREFIGEDARINARLRSILKEGRTGGASFEQLAGRIETEVAEPYEQSFEQLSALRVGPGVPSAAALDQLRRYAEARRDASHALAEGVRKNDPRQIRDALSSARQAARPQPKTPPAERPPQKP
jgi:rhomboid protease GluP